MLKRNLGKNGRGKKSRRKKMAHNFQHRQSFFVRLFLKACSIIIEFNLWISFIGIMSLDKLLMLFKATSVYHLRGYARRTLPSRPSVSRPRPGPPTPLDTLQFQGMLGCVFNTKKVWKREGRLFIQRQFFSLAFFPSAIFSWYPCKVSNKRTKRIFISRTTINV